MNTLMGVNMRFIGQMPSMAYRLLAKLASIGTACMLISQAATAQVSVSAPVFTPAQAGRTYMDIGGVWNGSAVTALDGGSLVSGDEFSFTYTNGPSTAFEFKPSITYPSSFLPIGQPTIVLGAGCVPLTSITLSGLSSGTGMTVNSVPSNTGLLGGFDLPAGCSFTLTLQGLMAKTATAGTVAIQAGYQSSVLDGGALVTGASTVTQTTLVRNGLSTLGKAPNNQSAAVGQTANWTNGLTVINTGLGGLFNVTLNESAISGMALTALSATGASCSGSLCTLPYLAPGAQMVGSASATVNACQNITNTVSTTDLTNTTAKSTSAQVTLNLQQPLLGFSAPSFSVPYTGGQVVSVVLSNSATGPAKAFASGTGIQLTSNLPALGVTVTGLAANWAYNSGTGTFSYTGGGAGGTIGAGTSTTLSFTASATNACSFSGGVLVMTAKYSDDCGNQFSVPTSVGAVSLGAGTPDVQLTKTSSAGTRQVIGSGATYTVNATLTNFANISGSNIVITDTLPAGVSGITLMPSVGTANCGGPCSGGSTVTWTIPKAALGAGPNATINLGIAYTAPTNVCLAGTTFVNNASYSGTSTASCPITNTTSSSVLLTLAPGAGVSQSYNVNLPVGVTAFETGLSDSNNNGVANKPSEGDQIPVAAEYTFGPGTLGTWAGSNFKDNFGAVTAGSAILSSTTLNLQIDKGTGTYSTVVLPSASVSCGAGTVAGLNCANNITLDLGFLAGAGYFGTANIAQPGKILRVKLGYSLTINDSAMTAPTSSAAITQLGTLTLASGTGGCGTGGTYVQGDLYNIVRAAPAATLTVPNVLDVCQAFDSPLTINNGSNNKNTYNILTSLFTGTGTDWRYTLPQTPTYGGAYPGLALTYLANGGNTPTWAHTNPLTPLTTPGTITSNLFLAATVANGATVASLKARVDYDDNQTAGGARDFANTNGIAVAGAVPLVRKGNIVPTVSPQTIFATGSTVQWRVYLTNTGNGTSYNTQFSDTLPARLIPDAVGTNALNVSASCAPQANCNVVVAGQQMSFNLGDIPAGQVRSVYIKATVSNASPGCGDVVSGPFSGVWGCGTPFENAQTYTAARPLITFPSSQMTAGHDSAATTCVLCGTGQTVVRLRNTGASNVYNLTTTETLNKDTQGTDYVPGSTEYSTDNGVTWVAGANPTVVNATTGAYSWSSTQVPPLAQLWPQSQTSPSQPYQVLIRFSFTTNNLTGTVANPQFTVQTTGTMSCGIFVSSGSQPFNLTVQKPSIAAAKTGINRSVAGGLPGTGSYTENVYGGTGDTVEWKVALTNSGTSTAQNVRLLDVFPGSGAATMSIVAGPTCAGVVYPISLSNNTASQNLCDLPSTGANTHTYYVREILGNQNCNVTGVNTAKSSFACNAAAAGAESGVNGLAGMSDTAQLIRQPDLTSFSGAGSQQFIQESNGRVRVEISLSNAGGTAQNIKIASVLSQLAPVAAGGWVLDTSTPARLYGTAVQNGVCIAPPASSNAVAGNYSCTCSGTACLSNTVSNTGTSTSPIFQTTGSMRNSTAAKLVFYVLPTNYDTTTASSFPAWTTQESTANGLDPSNLGPLGVNSTLTYRNTCSAADIVHTVNNSFDADQPDLDIYLFNATNTVQDADRIAVSSAPATPETFHFRVRNNGLSASSATLLNAQLRIGNGWGTPSAVRIISSTGSGFGTLPLNCTFTPGAPGTANCPIPATAQLGSGDEYVIQVIASPTYALGASLLMQLSRASGELTGFDSVSTGNYYSNDAARYRVIGAQVFKAMTNSSSSQPDTQSINPNLLIGEEVNYRPDFKLWGFAPEALTGFKFHDSYYRAGPTWPHNAFSFVSAGTLTATGFTTTPTVTLPAPVTFVSPTPRIVIDAAASTAAGEVNIAQDYRLRLINHGSLSSNNYLVRNNAGVSFNYGGQFFRSNAVDDGFVGGFGSGRLHADMDSVAKLPSVSITKQVCNITVNPLCNLATGAGFAASASGDASHEFVYRITVANAAGAAPAFDLVVSDSLPNNKLSMIAGSADGIVNASNCNGNETSASGAYVTGPAGSVTFNDNVVSFPTGATCTGSATMAQLDPGQSFVLAYRVAGVPVNITGGDSVTDQTTLTYSTLPGPNGVVAGVPGSGQTVTLSPGTPTPVAGTLGGLGERTYSTGATALVSFSRVYGRVYLDNNHNGSAEITDGNYVGTGVTTAPTPLLCAQLIQGGVFQATTPLTATGTFSFANAPSGTYEVRIVLALAGPTCPSSITNAWSPASYGYIPIERASQSTTFTVSPTAGAPAINFGLYQGTKITGKVFLDNTGLSTANDAVFNAQDTGLVGVPVCASTTANCAAGASLLASTSTDGSGDYELWVPLPLSPTTVYIVNGGSGKTSTGANVSGTVLPNNTALTVGGASYTYAYAAGIDTVRLSAVFGTAYGTVNFGEINAPNFTTDGATTVAVGSVYFYPHTYTASTSGSVSFVTSASGGSGWTEQIYRDNNCNGQIDAGELLIAAPITLLAGQSVCILMKENVPVTASAGSQNQVTLTATFTPANTTLVAPFVITHTDTTTVVAASSGSLRLDKLVRNTNVAGAPFTASVNSATAGDILEYKIVYTNTGAGSLNNVVVQDATPPYTTFVSAAAAALPNNLTACSKTTPQGTATCAAAQAAGGTGLVRWTFTGTLLSNQTGEVTFQVRVIP